jgi:GrpB-like predicted nucleotidyltransferase (UPF0157 family)
MFEHDPTDRVLVVEYDPLWPTVYQEEAKVISHALDHDFVEMHHIGSTSVPGLCAKPIIDILVAVTRFRPVEEYSRRLAPLGYRYVSHEDDAIRLFFHKRPVRTHHLHIVEHGSWEYQRHLIFRDYLRTHAVVAQEYGRLKRELADRFTNDRATYTASKTSFIADVVAMAIRGNAVLLAST